MTTSEPSTDRPALSWGSLHPLGILLGALAGVRHAALMTRATNDNFLHMTLAQQLLAGDWPMRDFFDGGWVLQYVLTAAAQIVVGNRLLAEATIVGLAWACSTYIVFRVVRHVTGSTPGATLAGILLVLAAARGYSYPKAIVYAVASLMWWQYVRQPTAARAAWLGVWAAIAFYWRPDHGVYVAIAIALAAWAAHGFSRTWIARCTVAGGVMLALIAPLMIYAQLTFGLPQYIQTGLAVAWTEHTTQGPHAWPILRFAGSIVSIEPADVYAPVVTIRWTQGSSIDARNKALAVYGVTPLEAEGDSTRVRLSPRALTELRRLINDPIVEDTAGIDRSLATVPQSSWTNWQRWSFQYAWMRIRVLPGLEDQERRVEFIVAILYLLPCVMALAAGSMTRSLAVGFGSRAFVAFAGFAFLVDLAMLRVPFQARVFDAVPISAIVFGCCIVWMWRATAGSVRTVAVRTSVVIFAVLLVANLARAGQFTNPLTWGGAAGELVASPPLRHYVDRRARFTLQLAAYVRECVPLSDRLLVLWFEPEIYYFSERLMAQRHLIFAPVWATLAHEQSATLQKVQRFAPPIVLARESALEEYARATYPGVIEYVESHYVVATTIDNENERYVIFTRKDREPVRGFGSQNWPCFVSESSPWVRVGHEQDQRDNRR